MLALAAILICVAATSLISIFEDYWRSAIEFLPIAATEPTDDDIDRDLLRLLLLG